FALLAPRGVGQLLAMFERGQQPRRAFRRDDPGGMRIERQQRRREVLRARKVEYALNEPLVPNVDTVKVADGERCLHTFYSSTRSSRDPKRGGYAKETGW